MKLSGLFDGELHWLVPDEDFTTPATLIVAGWKDDGEQDPLDVYESPSQTPLIQDTTLTWTKIVTQRWNTEQAWGALSVALSIFCNIVGVDKEQYQHNYYDEKNHLSSSRFSFKSKTGMGDRL